MFRIRNSLRGDILLFLMSFIAFGLYSSLPNSLTTIKDLPYWKNYLILPSVGGVGAFILAFLFLWRAYASIRKEQSGLVLAARLLLSAFNCISAFVLVYLVGQMFETAWHKCNYATPGDLWYFSTVTFFNIGSGCCSVEGPDGALLRGIALLQAICGVVFIAILLAMAVSRFASAFSRDSTEGKGQENEGKPTQQEERSDSERLPIPAGPKDAGNIELYKLAVDTRKLELTLFWQRSTFFWGFLAAVLAGYVLANQQSWIRVLLANLGLVAGACWWLVNKGSKYWHENWEQMVTRLEDAPNGLFSRTAPLESKGILGAAGYSVSKITIFFSGCMTVLFLGLSLYELVRPYKNSVPTVLVLIMESLWPKVLFLAALSAIWFVSRRGKSGSVNRTRWRPRNPEA